MGELRKTKMLILISECQRAGGKRFEINQKTVGGRARFETSELEFGQQCCCRHPEKQGQEIEQVYGEKEGYVFEKGRI